MGVVDELMNLHARTACFAACHPQIADHLLAGHRHVVIVEVPRHHNQHGRDDERVPAAHFGAPFHGRGEPSILEGHWSTEPSAVNLRVGESGKGRCLVGIHIDVGNYDMVRAGVRQGALRDLVGRRPLERSFESAVKSGDCFLAGEVEPDVPTAVIVTNPESRSTERCWEIVGAVTSNASAIAPAGNSRSQIRPKISRRTGELRAVMTLSMSLNQTPLLLFGNCLI